VEVGDAIGKIDENAEAGETETKEEPKAETEQPKEEQKEEPKAPAASEEEEEVSSDDGFVASPAARKRARELNIDLSKVTANDPLRHKKPEDGNAADKGAAKSP